MPWSTLFDIFRAGQKKVRNRQKYQNIHRVLQGVAQRGGGEFYFIFAVLGHFRDFFETFSRLFGAPGPEAPETFFGLPQMGV